MIKLKNGNCLEKMKEIEKDSIDMVFTSPPYAERRSKTECGGISSDNYVEWFYPIAVEIYRILKPTGSFFLNIKPHTLKGRRSLYVFDLVTSLSRKNKFWYIDELCWSKNAFPGKLRGRLKNGFEPVYHFTKDNPNQIIFNPQAAGTPIKPESIARTYRKQCGPPANGSGMTGMNTTNIRQLKIARPSNIIHINNVSNQFTDKQKHPATFPTSLVEFFLKTYTNENCLVIDPFMGSGTTGIACKNLNRNFIGIELSKTYFHLAEKRIQDA